MFAKTNLYQKNGHIHYNITEVKVLYTLEGLKLRMDNLFEGVKVLGEFICASLTNSKNKF